MLLRIASQAKYPIVCVVRRAEQVQLLKSMGAERVLNSADVDFGEQLAAACRQVNATAAFEAVAGDMTRTLLISILPVLSCMSTGPSAEPCGNIDPIDLIFRNKTVTGFYLGEWIRRRGTFGVAARESLTTDVDGRANRDQGSS